MTFEDYYELGGMGTEHIATSDNIRIETGINIDPNLNYVKINRCGQYGKVCRLCIDKAEYYICDFYPTDDELNIITKILKDNWQRIISVINENKDLEKLYPLIPTNLQIPDYNILKEHNNE